MKYRELGHGLKVSAIGVGCMPMIKGGNITYGEDADPGEAIKTIHH
jgi:aryl-alcohol dehydrogenase-like predicted oxidoreductase